MATIVQNPLHTTSAPMTNASVNAPVANVSVSTPTERKVNFYYPISEKMINEYIQNKTPVTYKLNLYNQLYNASNNQRTKDVDSDSHPDLKGRKFYRAIIKSDNGEKINIEYYPDTEMDLSSRGENSRGCKNVWIKKNPVQASVYLRHLSEITWYDDLYNMYCRKAKSWSPFSKRTRKRKSSRKTRKQRRL